MGKTGNYHTRESIEKMLKSNDLRPEMRVVLEKKLKQITSNENINK